MARNDLTKGALLPHMMAFAVPYLVACFLQSFYGMADLFITGWFNGAAPVTAVSIGSQVTQFLTVVTIGLVMGCTISVSRALGGRRMQEVSVYIGNTISLFAVLAFVFTGILFLSLDTILSLLATPPEALADAQHYLRICFSGYPFIIAYNVLAGIFRGLGDTKTPMYCVSAAGVLNILLDYILIGPFSMGAPGAAWATIGSQAVAFFLALFCLLRKDMGFTLTKKDFAPDLYQIQQILYIGLPISCQDGFIQVSFLVITAIANSKGVDVAAAVGIVEKIIGFLFLVPSAMLSTVSTTAAQNAGAGLHQRSRQAMYYGMGICLAFGLLCILFTEFHAEWMVSLFVANEPEVIRLGGQYLRSYVFDVPLAAIHFCFSGYFCAYKKSMYSFFHNMASIVLVRVPGTYLMAVLFPASLYPMGLASPAGSLLSILICVVLYRWKRFAVGG